MQDGKSCWVGRSVGRSFVNPKVARLTSISEVSSVFIRKVAIRLVESTYPAGFQIVANGWIGAPINGHLIQLLLFTLLIITVRSLIRTRLKPVLGEITGYGRSILERRPVRLRQKMDASESSVVKAACAKNQTKRYTFYRPGRRCGECL